MSTIESLLREHAFLSTFPDYLIPVLAGCTSQVKFESGDVIFHESESAGHMYLIRGGKVSLEINMVGRGQMVIDTLEAGDVLGWSWLVPPYHWHFGARAIEPTMALRLDAESLRDKCEKNHEFGYEFMKRFITVFYSRIQATRLQILDLHGPTAEW